MDLLLLSDFFNTFIQSSSAAQTYPKYTVFTFFLSFLNILFYTLRPAHSSFNFPRTFLLANKKVPGKLKDECAGRAIAEYVSLRPKMYSILGAGGINTKKAKGVKKNVVTKHISTSSTKRPYLKSKPSAMAWMSCGQSAIVSTDNI